MESINITWYANDGYISRNRPQTTEFYLDDFVDCETFEDAKNVVAAAVQLDFEERVSPDFTIDEAALRKFWEEARAIDAAEA